MDREKVTEYRKLLVELREVQANLSFPKLLMKNVATKISSKYGQKWKFDEAHTRDFNERMGERLRCLCGHVGKALSRRQVASWVVALFAQQVVEPPEAATEEAAAGAEAAPAAAKAVASELNQTRVVAVRPGEELPPVEPGTWHNLVFWDEMLRIPYRVRLDEQNQPVDGNREYGQVRLDPTVK